MSQNRRQLNFSGGELAPSLHARNDIVKYQTGAKTLRNMTIMRSGGAQNRAGSQFIGEVVDSTKDVRLKEFGGASSDRLVEFGDGYARFFEGGELVTKNWSRVYSATNAATCVVQVINGGNATDGAQTAAILLNTRVTFSGVSGMTQLNGNTYKAKNITIVSSRITQFDLYSTSDVAVDSTAFGVFASSDAGIATSATAITGATQANPLVLSVVGNGLQVGDLFNVAGVLGMTQINGRTFKVASRTENTITVDELDGTNVNATGYTAYVSGGTISRVLVLPSPYSEEDLRYLNFTQVGKTMAIAHGDYLPRTLIRYDDEDYYFGLHSFDPAIVAPVNTTSSGSASHYVITAVDALTFEESLISADVEAAGTTVAWTHTGGAAYYNIYKGDSGFYGWIGSAGSSPFSDSPAITPDFSITPPLERAILESADNYPGVVTDFQQRRIFARSHNYNDTGWASRTGLPTNFTVQEPLTDDAAVTFRLVAKRQQEIRHLLDVGGLISLTNRGPWIVAGDQADILRPDSVNPRQYGQHGCDYAAPVVVGGAVIYVHVNRSLVISFGAEVSGSGYAGTDLTVFSSHLFDGYLITELAWQTSPDSIVWARRSDGKLLALTYMKEHDIWGWTQCDTDGEVENICVVQESNHDYLYLVVSREVEVAGVLTTKKYIERMTPRLFTDRETTNAVFLDSHLTYDGTNEGSTTMTLSGSGWTYEDTITCTASASTFASTDVGNAVHIEGSDGTEIRFTITGYSSPTVVTGTPHMTVPAAMRATAISDWSLAVDQVTNLWHLEGRDVAVLADGTVVANPLVDSYTTITVENGTITLDRPYAIIHVGLPYICDVETLDLDSAGGQSVSDRNILVNKVSLRLDKSRGIYVGPAAPSDDDEDPLEGLTPAKARTRGDNWGPISLTTREVDVMIDGKYSRGGRVFVRQVDPLPMSILSITPHFTVNRER